MIVKNTIKEFGEVEEKTKEIEFLKNAILLKEYDVNLNYKLGLLLFEKGEYIDALRCFFIILNEKDETFKKDVYKMMDVILNVKDKKQIIKINNLIKYNKHSQATFPYNQNDTCIGDFLFDKFIGVNDEGFYYKRGLAMEDLNSQSENYWYMNVLEILTGTRKRLYRKNINQNTIIPVSTTENLRLNINVNGNEYEKILAKNRWNYLRFDEGDKIKIKSDREFILGNEFELKQDVNKPKIILNIFIDGLSQKYLEKEGIKNIMPNTDNFFNKGTYFQNCYVSGEWTFVSLASFYTGLYTHNHNIFHPNKNTDNLNKHTLFTDVLKENGYFVSKIDGDWRSSPAYGYCKNVDRTIYCPSIKYMNANDVVINAIEHMEAFKEMNQFLWICLPDLHDIADGYESNLSIQTKESIKLKCIKDDNSTSVQKKYSTDKIEKYRLAIKRIDTYLSLLYSYILNNFTEDEFVVNLISDHGQGYLVKDGDFFLEEHRIKVPLMIRGKNIPKKKSNELVQGLDLYSILIKQIGGKDGDNKDSMLPVSLGGSLSREYVFSESIFPGATYKASIIDENIKFFFETKAYVGDSGEIDIRQYTYKVLDRRSNKEISIDEEFKDKYINIIFEKIKNKIF